MTVTTDETTAAQTLAYRYLIDDRLFERLVNRLVRKGIARVLAERKLNEALGFLRLLALNPGIAFSPSPDFDDAWHEFMLDSVPYTEFCYRIAGRYLHHVPIDTLDGKGDCTGEGDDGCVGGGGNVATTYRTVAQTMAAMMELGPMDVELWGDKQSDCTGCYNGDHRQIAS